MKPERNKSKVIYFYVHFNFELICPEGYIALLYKYGYCGNLILKNCLFVQFLWGVLFSHKGRLLFIKLPLALSAYYSSFRHAILASAILAPSCQGDMLWAADALANSGMKPNYGCKTLLSCICNGAKPRQGVIFSSYNIS